MKSERNNKMDYDT